MFFLYCFVCVCQTPASSYLNISAVFTTSYLSYYALFEIVSSYFSMNFIAFSVYFISSICGIPFYSRIFTASSFVKTLYFDFAIKSYISIVRFLVYSMIYFNSFILYLAFYPSSLACNLFYSSYFLSFCIFSSCLFFIVYNYES